MISQDAANFFLVLVFGPPVIILSLALSEICLTALTEKFGNYRRGQSIPEGAEENLRRGFSLSSEIEAAETPKEEEREEEVRP